MKHFFKVIIGMSAFALLICLFIIFTPSSSYTASARTVLGSAVDKGITLTIDDYSIKNGNELTLHYTVQTKSGHTNNNGMSLIKEPDIFIGDKLVHGSTVWQKKIGNQKYAGSLKVELPQYRPAQSNVELNTDGVLNQKGQWTIGFKLK